MSTSGIATGRLFVIASLASLAIFLLFALATN
jgi:hypothetical protein